MRGIQKQTASGGSETANGKQDPMAQGSTDDFLISMLECHNTPLSILLNFSGSPVFLISNSHYCSFHLLP
jgi:hypothetical protein